MSTVSFRTDDNVKKQADELFEELGLTMSTALNMFLRQAVRERRIPFEVTAQEPSRSTIEAIMEGRRLLNDPSARRFKNADELFAELGIE